MSWRRPPRALRQAQLDNLVLVPASLLPRKAEYQLAANKLPRGQVLIVLPFAEGTPRRALQGTAAQLRSHGRQVTTLAAESL